MKRIILLVFSLFIISSHGLNAQVDTCLHIDFETVNGEIGDTVCVKIKVSNFKDILSFQFPINYDPRVVIPLPATIDSIADIEGFDANGIVTDFTRAAIRVVYANPNNDTVNLPDGSVLFIICFKLIGAPGDCSKISFSDRPIAAEFVRRYPVDNDIPVCIIEDNPKDEICINVPDSLTVLNYTCGTFTNTGKITIKAWGGRSPYTVTCNSTIPPTNSTINKAGDCLIIGGQMAGVYNFRVVDALGKDTIFNVTVNASSSIKIIQDNNYSIDPTCWYSSNGRLGITFNGGSGTPFVKWLPINAFGVNRLSGLMKGKYTVVVTDTAGCSESLDLELRADSLIGQLTIDRSATCKGFCDGKATIRASGGTPCLGRNYEFVWSGPQRLDCPRDTVCRNDSLCGNQFVV
ncbi:MAG: cohesin domain-containing protein, partial [Saprospiraceae bacterium]